MSLSIEIYLERFIIIGFSEEIVFFKFYYFYLVTVLFNPLNLYCWGY